MSNEYRHILVAVDLTKDSHKVLERAAQIAERNQGAKLSIMHTLEPLGFAYGGDIPMDLTSIQDQLDEHAWRRSPTTASPGRTSTCWWACPIPRSTASPRRTTWT